MAINLDFRHYIPDHGAEKVYEMESGMYLGEDFSYGFVSDDFTEFLNYLLSFAKSKSNLPPFSEEPEFTPRFHDSFPESERLVVERIMNHLGINIEACDLSERIEKSLRERRTLIARQTDQERMDAFTYMPE